MYSRQPLCMCAIEGALSCYSDCMYAETVESIAAASAESVIYVLSLVGLRYASCICQCYWSICMVC